MPEERLLALLQADRVHDGLPLQALQPRLDHVPLRAVEHDGQLRDVRLGREEVQETRHRGDAVQHPLVHVHVEEVRAPVDLLARHGERALVVAREDELRELRRPRDVRPLAHERERLLGPERVRLEAGKAGAALGNGDPPRGQPLHGLGDRADVRGRRAAAAAHDVHPPLAREAADVRAHDLGRLVEAAERVREARVRIRAQRRRARSGKAPRRRASSPSRRARS